MKQAIRTVQRSLIERLNNTHEGVALVNEYDAKPLAKGPKMDPEAILSLVPIALNAEMSGGAISPKIESPRGSKYAPLTDVQSYGLLKAQVAALLNTLASREQEVIVLRFGLEDGRRRTQAEVGAQLHLTGARVGQIEASALRKLHHPSRRERLRDLLDAIAERLMTKQAHLPHQGD